MAFKDLHKLKKVKKEDTQIINCEHLIIGNDIFALEAASIIKDKFPEDKNVKILFKGELSSESLSLKGPLTIRGENNLNKILEIKPELEVKKCFPETVYFKDLKLKPFSGRGKPEKLLKGEKYFTEDRLGLNSRDLFTVLNNDETLESFENNIEAVTPMKISKDDDIWHIHCVNGDIYRSKYLYWGEGPWNFLKLYENKSELTDKFIEFAEGTKAPCALNISIKFAKKVTDLKETLFVPLSYTHEWGHFIGEFDVTDEGKPQVAHFVHFLDKDHTSEELVSRKIRIFKKNLEKMIPDIKKVEGQEFICLSEKSYSDKVNDKLFFKDANSPGNLVFFGYNAPLVGQVKKDNTEIIPEISHLARSLASLRELNSII